MAVTHTNRRGKVYHLQSATTKTGKTKYSFTLKTPTNPVAQLPDGFEIYENPDNAQVFLRKAVPTNILPEEREAVDAAIRRLAGLKHFIVECDEDALVVWTPDNGPESTDRLFDRLNGPESADHLLDLLGGGTFPSIRSTFRDEFVQRSRYSKMMRFTLVDGNCRLFQVERWCFRGSIDDWFFLAGSGKLNALLAKYVPHLGKESFYDLF